jgi:two-component system, sensor histidine kinase and response regulator
VAHEDNERRIEAGMDGFLAKPFDMHVLFQTVESPPRGIGLAAPAQPALAQPAPPPPTEGVAEHLWRTTAGNEKLIQSLVKSFLADAPKKFSDIRRAVSQKNAEKLASAAHALKGAMAIFGAQKAVAAARNLETLGRTGNVQDAAAEFRALEEELHHLTRNLLALQAESKRAAKLPAKSRRPAPRSRRKR